MSPTPRRCYVGEFRHALDAKNRLTIPAKWRSSMGDVKEVFLALPNPVGSITVYPPEMVAKLEEKVSRVSLGDRRGQKAITRLFSRADDLTFDAQGRFGLHERLTAHAGIGREVILAGNFSTFDLWDPARFEEYLARDDREEKDDEISEILRQLGL